MRTPGCENLLFSPHPMQNIPLSCYRSHARWFVTTSTAIGHENATLQVVPIPVTAIKRKENTINFDSRCLFRKGEENASIPPDYTVGNRSIAECTKTHNKTSDTCKGEIRERENEERKRDASK